MSEAAQLVELRSKLQSTGLHSMLFLQCCPTAFDSGLVASLQSCSGQKGLDKCLVVASLGHWLPELTAGAAALGPASHRPTSWSLGDERAQPLQVRQAISARAVTVVTSCSPAGIVQEPHLVSSSRAICLGDIRVSLPLPSPPSEDTAHGDIRPSVLPSRIQRWPEVDDSVCIPFSRICGIWKQLRQPRGGDFTQSRRAGRCAC